MTKVTNTAAGPRGVILADGSTHYLEAGETADLDLHKDHDLYEGVEKGGPKAKANEDPSKEEPKALSKMNKAELLETAKAEGVAVADDASNKDIADAIAKAREAK